MANFDQGYALIVGVANYPNVNPLPPTVLKDARDVAAILQDINRAGYPQANVKLLLDKDATKQNILNGLAWLASSANAGKDATAVFYFSGHGGRIPDGANAGNYLIPFDTVLNTIKATAISSDELTAALNAIQTQKLVVLLDACHSGGTGDTKGDLTDSGLINAGTKDIGEPDVTKGLDEKTYDQLKTGSGRVIFASSKTDEVSYVLPNAQNSLFTQCLLEAMNGQAKQAGDGFLRIFDLANYLFDKVPARQPKQHPILKVNDLDKNFAVSLYLGGEKSITPAQQSDGSLHVTIIAKQRVDISDETALRDFIANNFSVDDLDTLCQTVAAALQKDGFKQRFSLDLVTSTRKPLTNMAQDVVLWLNRRGKLNYLVNALHDQFPDEIQALP